VCHLAEQGQKNSELKEPLNILPTPLKSAKWLDENRQRPIDLSKLIILFRVKEVGGVVESVGRE
jgi:hypothetical protein